MGVPVFRGPFSGIVKWLPSQAKRNSVSFAYSLINLEHDLFTGMTLAYIRGKTEGLESSLPPLLVLTPHIHVRISLGSFDPPTPALLRRVSFVLSRF